MAMIGTSEMPYESTAARLVALIDHLGLARAHVATQIPADIAGLAAAHPGRLGGIVLCAPVRLDPAPFRGVADRLLMISGEYGPTFEVSVRAAGRLPGAQRQIIDNYEALGWSDVVHDCSAEIAGRMTGFLQRFTADAPPAPPSEGSHAGVTYRIEGSGPALLLLPFFLAPSQWAPAIPDLARHFTVVTLGGRHLGGIAALEDRARMPTYRAMFRTLVDTIAPQPGEAILDVGCGAGSLDRPLAHRLGTANPLTALDANPFWLKEAEALAFGAVFSVTVIEECDADRAIAEMVRVAAPGGRIGIVVRAVDLPQWWNLDLPEEIRRRSRRRRNRSPRAGSPMPASIAGCAGPGSPISYASRSSSRSTSQEARSGATARTTCCRY